MPSVPDTLKMYTVKFARNGKFNSWPLMAENDTKAKKQARDLCQALNAKFVSLRSYKTNRKIT